MSHDTVKMENMIEYELCILGTCTCLQGKCGEMPCLIGVPDTDQSCAAIVLILVLIVRRPSCDD